MNNNKDIVKYFYEVIISENLLDELFKYILEDYLGCKIEVYRRKLDE